MATPDKEILQRLTRVRAEIDAAAAAAGRDPAEVRLLLATKTQPAGSDQHRAPGRVSR